MHWDIPILSNSSHGTMWWDESTDNDIWDEMGHFVNFQCLWSYSGIGFNRQKCDSSCTNGHLLAMLDMCDAGHVWCPSRRSAFLEMQRTITHTSLIWTEELLYSEQSNCLLLEHMTIDIPSVVSPQTMRLELLQRTEDLNTHDKGVLAVDWNWTGPTTAMPSNTHSHTYSFNKTW